MRDVPAAEVVSPSLDGCGPCPGVFEQAGELGGMSGEQVHPGGQQHGGGDVPGEDEEDAVRQQIEPARAGRRFGCEERQKVLTWIAGAVGERLVEILEQLGDDGVAGLDI